MSSTRNSLDPLDCVSYNLRRTTRAVTALYDDILRPSGLRSTQFTLLHQLSLQDGIALVPLSRKAGMDRTTLARGLETLQQAGLVRLAGDHADARKSLAHLTPQGRKALDAALPLWRKAQTQTLKLLPAKNWEKLFRRLHTIDQALETGSPSQEPGPG